MRKLIFFLLILLAATWLGIKIAEDPGYFLVAYQHWTMEMPLWLAIVILFLVFFGFHFLLNFFKTTRLLPKRIRAWSVKRRAQQSDELTHQGLIALSRGEWSKAEKKLSKAAQKSNRSWVHHLFLALSAHHQKKYQAQEMAMNKALAITPESETAVEILKAQFQMTQQQWEQARITLEKVHARVPTQSYVMRLLAPLYIQLKKWEKFLILLPQLHKHSDFPPAEIQEMEVTVFENIFLENKQNTDRQLLQTIWDEVPKPLRENPRLVSVYAQALNTAQAGDEAEKLIRKTQAKNWNSDLAYVYGLINTSQVDHQLRQAEKWLPAHQQDPQLLLTLGKLSIKNQLWGKARSYLESSLLFASTPEAYFELGKLFETLGENEKALECYRSGLSCRSAQA
jgi:HemY protein